MHMASPLKRLTNKPKMLSEDIQLRFLKRLDRFTANGYPLQDALEAIGWDKELSDIATEFVHSLKRGERLDNVFESTGFHPSICSFLHFTHANSNLREAISKCIELLEQHFKNTKKFKTLIRYPIVLMIIFSIILFFINHEVLPAFQSLFQTSTQAFATVTILKWILDCFQFLFLLITISLLICLIIWKQMTKRISIEDQLKILKHIPMFRYYLRIQTSFQFATHFTSLLKAGLTLKEILHELANQQRLPIISYYSILLRNNLERGFHVSSLLAELTFIENQLAAIFQKNATIQVLEKDLSLYSDILLEEMQRIIIQAITFVQPVFYIAIGIFVIFIYLCLMWPMFQMMNTF